ncbi:uncharacterized protein LOC103783767 isoform X2 [Pan paniscus]|uniref:uncharacterized protein LOC103783767 isoform X2 n=1 Tax=Pan paniscus TaxID=9597 RepID=UPI00155F5D97|nr:uncharacterized protein LOC103783767 isoform X2 [Pan paniscus]
MRHDPSLVSESSPGCLLETGCSKEIGFNRSLPPRSPEISIPRGKKMAIWAWLPAPPIWLEHTSVTFPAQALRAFECAVSSLPQPPLFTHEDTEAHSGQVAGPCSQSWGQAGLSVSQMLLFRAPGASAEVTEQRSENWPLHAAVSKAGGMAHPLWLPHGGHRPPAQDLCRNQAVEQRQPHTLGCLCVPRLILGHLLLDLPGVLAMRTLRQWLGSTSKW